MGPVGAGGDGEKLRRQIRVAELGETAGDRLSSLLWAALFGAVWGHQKQHL